jgi:hypothetical protein
VTGTFAANTPYTATITLTTKAGYTLQGVGANSFTVAGATTVTNAADSGVVTAVFPATAAAAPAAPVVPVVTLEPDNRQIIVTWGDVTGVVSYQVVWAVGVNTPPASLNATNSSADTITKLSYTISGLTNNSSYSVWVRGKKADGTYTGYSEKQTATPIPSDAPPVKPVITTVTPTDNGEIKIEWEAAKGATTYDVRVGAENNLLSNPRVVASDVTVTTVTTGSGATLGVPVGAARYYVWVTAKNTTTAGVPQSVNSDPKEVNVVQPPENAAAFEGTTWKSAFTTYEFKPNARVVFTGRTPAESEEGTYTYNKPDLNFTLGTRGQVGPLTVKGKTFEDNGLFTMQ